MKYRILYRDEAIGEPHDWGHVLYWVAKAMRLPYRFHPVLVIEWPDKTGTTSDKTGTEESHA